MTNPGFLGQQAAQQAAASASRGAAQNAATAYNTTVQNASRLSHRHPHRPSRGGFFGLVGRLVRLVFSLVVIVMAVGIFLMILTQAMHN